MSEKRIIIIMHNDLMHYPPMISLIDILTELGEHVTYIGDYTESPTTRRFVSSGVNLIKLGYKRTGSQFNRLRAQFIYKKELKKILKNLAVNQLDLLWYVYSDSATFLHDLLSRYRYIVHYYEFDRLEYSWKFKLLYPSFDQSTLVQKAAGVVHCEYNRAQIFKGMTGLKKCPFVLPNKPYIKEGVLDEPNMPQNIKLLIDEIKQKTEGKKVILYQGIFNSSERKLEEFCQAVNLLQDDYVLIAMGRGFAWLDTGNHDSLLDAADFVAAFQKRQGLYISCIEEIAYKRGFIDKEQLLKLAEPLMKTDYGKYMKEVAEGL